MHVGKWGNSLAIRLPTAIVEMLALKEGDDIEIAVAGDRHFEISRSQGREDALARLKSLGLRLPSGYSFKRDDAYQE